MTISADEAMRLAGDALVEAAHVSDEWGIDKYVTNGDDCAAAVIRALDAAGYEVRAKGVTSEMISAAATSQATDDEGTWLPLMDLINFSGENKTRTVIRAALESALAAAPKLVEVKP